MNTEPPGTRARPGLAVRLCARWWELHTRPGPEHASGNITRTGWQPRTPALLIGAPLLATTLLLAPVLADRLGRASGSAPPARCLAWTLCLAAVFGYVAKVTTGRGGSPWRGRHGGHRDVAVVLLAAPALALAVRLPQTAADSALALALPLAVGAHFSYTEKLPRAAVRSLDLAGWHDARPVERGWMLARMLVLAAVAAGLTVRLLLSPPAGPWIAAGSAALGLGLWRIGRKLRPAGYHPYVHHWFVFLWLAVLSTGSTPLVALASGAFVEGAARWSCAPLWHLDTRRNAI
ncbi:hypothetical protein GCM10010269_78530 [Streptomyces humidus]|uniref:Uncharacterized protein n=1 Tax=Streptomyces humidus TaxID=52259 RepID=A0A918GCE6_9ACTN|nr:MULTISPECIES: hypothetical protein [Streptomyces]GGS28175.1 hypothetical protein GCM10010269_78530 [Streptomyces humidus]